MQDTARRVSGYGLPAVYVVGLLALAGRLGPVARFLGATVGLLLTIKVGSWVLLAGDGEVDRSPVELLLYWTVWPGVRPDQFAAADAQSDPEASTFVVGYVHVLVGVALVVGSLLAVPVVGVRASTWLLVFGVLSVVHFGVGRILPFGLRYVGIPAPPLFDDPLRSESVAAFWSERWNRPFVGMSRLFVTRPLSRRVGMGVAASVAFAVSGLLHELALSYTAGGGWGGPLLYFLVQTGVYTLEQRTGFPGEETNVVLARLWTYAAVLAPVPLLFHWPFRATFVAPVVEWGRGLLLAHPLTAYLSAGLWVGAAGHFLVLVASAQVPSELEWETDLQSLQPLNRKLLWTYGGFIVLTIVSFGVLTVLYHSQLVSGTPVAVGLAGFVTVFWTARVLVDALYFDHDDWPEGVEYVVGHALLTSLFLLLILVYGAAVVHGILR